MLGFGFRLSAVVAAMLILGAQAKPRSPLQQIADEAALAGVQVLGTGGEEADAVNAARQMAATLPNVTTEVSASPADLVVTVTLSATDLKAKTSNAVSTARYLPPDQPVVWNWASRQRFAVKTSPVVFGSTCPQGCDPDSVR